MKAVLMALVMTIRASSDIRVPRSFSLKHITGFRQVRWFSGAPSASITVVSAETDRYRFCYIPLQQSVTIHRGSASPSDALTKLRADALDILMELYRSAASIDEKQRIENTMFEATAAPMSAAYPAGLLVTILDDTVRVVDFCREVASTDAYEIIQRTEDRLLWLHRRNRGIFNDTTATAETLVKAGRLSAAIRALPIKGLQAKYKLSKNRRGRVMLGLQVGAVFVPPPKAATPGRQMQKGQLQAAHTTPRSHNGHRASERPPCCHKESAVASCLSLLAREPPKRDRFETSSAAQPEAQPTLPAFWRSCD